MGQAAQRCPIPLPRLLVPPKGVPRWGEADRWDQQQHDRPWRGEGSPQPWPATGGPRPRPGGCGAWGAGRTLWRRNPVCARARMESVLGGLGLDRVRACHGPSVSLWRNPALAGPCWPAGPTPRRGPFEARSGRLAIARLLRQSDRSACWLGPLLSGPRVRGQGDQGSCRDRAGRPRQVKGLGLERSWLAGEGLPPCLGSDRPQTCRASLCVLLALPAWRAAECWGNMEANLKVWALPPTSER